jgi:hypothetical protein
MRIPILKQITELSKRRNEIAMGTTGKKGRDILKELMDEHITQFSWMTINMVSHYIKITQRKMLCPL